MRNTCFRPSEENAERLAKAVVGSSLVKAHLDAQYMLQAKGVPRCDACGGPVKPDVVLYEEGLDNQTLSDAVRYIRDADVLIIGGTSLVVYPAAGLIDYYRGNKLVLVNKTPTARDGAADLVVQGSIGEIFAAL